MTSAKGLTADDRAIMDRLPLRVACEYLHADVLDARATRRRLLPLSGSVVESVCREYAAAALLDRRAACDRLLARRALVTPVPTLVRRALVALAALRSHLQSRPAI